MKNLKSKETFPQEKNSIVFTQTNKEIIKFCENGDIFVKEKLVENDKEVVAALRDFLKETGFLK